MAKKVTGYIKLQIPAGKATPAPPVGPALGQHGVNIVQFTKEFNARTADQGDLIIPVVITVYADRSFSFITKTPPAAVLLKKACKLKSGSAAPNKTKVATISKEDLEKIKEKLQDELDETEINIINHIIDDLGKDLEEKQKTLKEHEEEIVRCAETFFKQYGAYFSDKEKLLILEACKRHDWGKANLLFQALMFNLELDEETKKG